MDKEYNIFLCSKNVTAKSYQMSAFPERLFNKHFKQYGQKEDQGMSIMATYSHYHLHLYVDNANDDNYIPMVNCTQNKHYKII